MEIQDRSPLPEKVIFQLWEDRYFDSKHLLTKTGHPVQIISTGQCNSDAGPDFKNITIRVNDVLLQGDLEIHRQDSDWYQHAHHHDSAYNNVIMHLVIGAPTLTEPILRLNQTPVPVEVYIDIPDSELQELLHENSLQQTPTETWCTLQEHSIDDRLKIIEFAGQIRIQQKAERFLEGREHASWNQLLYIGIMDALGYSKNQTAFRKLANLLPFEAISRYVHESPNESLLLLQALFFGIAGLLPSQDPRLFIQDSADTQYIDRLEQAWIDIKRLHGVTPMRKEEWQFFRLRPTNFPSRRLVGASLLLMKFVEHGILETLLTVAGDPSKKPRDSIKACEQLFICQINGYWAEHYQLDGSKLTSPQPTLIGASRARDIVVNVVLPGLMAYAQEVKNSAMRAQLQRIYFQYPKLSSYSVIEQMIRQCLSGESKLINSAQRQQGLLHLYYVYCRRFECDRCIEFVAKI
ncbi:DUF2851 family protein [candidate division KSB1 bacterium]|nr:DUF2851 family protein [candidate division KSB1 bacterium]